MDERRQELDELQNYGRRLLEEMRYPDIIGMLQETISHIAAIAEEYSAEAQNWHGKYEESAGRNEELQEQIADMTERGKQENQKLCEVIEKQANEIERMGSEFAEKIEELRKAHTQETEEYSKKLQKLLAVQKSLDSLKQDVEEKQEQLEKDLEACRQEKIGYENVKAECEQQIKVNQYKLDTYERLYQFELDAQQKIRNAEQEAAREIEAANNAAFEWEKKYHKEHELREKIEKEKKSLQEMLRSKDDTSGSTEDSCQWKSAEPCEEPQNSSGYVVEPDP